MVDDREQREIEAVKHAIVRAGHEWINANGGETFLGWADVPDEVFARAAIEALDRIRAEKKDD